MERLLRASELAELLDVSVITLKKWRHRGYGPAYKRLLGDRGEIRYPESLADAWMNSDLNQSYAEELSKRPQEGFPKSSDKAAKSGGYDGVR